VSHGWVVDSGTRTPRRVVAVALVAATKTPPARAFAAFCAFTCAAGVILSLSRGGLIAMAVALLAAVFFGGRWRALAAVVLVVTAVGTVSYFAFLAPAAQRERITMTEDSGAGREDIWTIGWRMVKDEPVKGIGIGQFQTSAVHYLLEPGAINRADLIVDKPKVAHNTYLQVLSELGIVGLILFLGVIGTCITCALRAAWNFRDSAEMGYELISRALVVGLLGYSAANFFISNQWSKQYWILLALCPAIYAVSKRNPAEEASDDAEDDSHSGKSLPLLPATRTPRGRVTAPARP
jgi:O-antigen ligase